MSAYNPLSYGITGDNTLYAFSGKAGSVSGNCNGSNILPGCNILLCDGGSSLPITPSVSTFQQPSTYVLGTPLGSISLPIPLNLTQYDSIKFNLSCIDDGSKTFKVIPYAGLWMLLYDSNGVLQSQTCCSTTQLGSSKIFTPFSIDHRGVLTSISTITFVLNYVMNISGVVLSHLGYNQNGPISNTGVGFILTIQGGLACSDLRTQVVSNTSGIMTLATALSTSVPVTPSDGSVSVGNVNVGLYRDETTLFQTFLNTVGNAQTIEFPHGCIIPISQTINTIGLIGQKWIGDGSVGGAANTSGNPGLLWIGACGQPLLSLNRSRDFTFQDIVLIGNGHHEPLSLFEIDMVGTSSSVITTNHHYQRCFLQGPYNFPNHACVAIARTSQANCEFMKFEDCIFYPSQVPYEGGYGVWVGYSQNAKSELLYNCKFGFGSGCLYLGNGSFQAMDCSGDYQQWSFMINASTEPIRIQGHNAENCANGVWTGTNMPVDVLNNRWSSIILPNNSAPFYATGTPLYLRGNKIAPVSPVPVPNGFTNNLVDTANEAHIISQGNNWGGWYMGILKQPHALDTLKTQYGDYISIRDVFNDGFTQNLIQTWIYQ